MGMLVNILFIAFISIGVVLMVISYYPILKDYFLKNKLQQDETEVEQQLSILRSSSDSAKKANAFVTLMDLSYVLVHTLVNGRNNYDDQIQNIRFKKSLTPEMIKRLNALDGKYIQ